MLFTRTDKDIGDKSIEKKTAGLKVVCPVPGTIVKVFVKEGDSVKIGDKLCSL